MLPQVCTCTEFEECFPCWIIHYAEDLNSFHIYVNETLDSHEYQPEIIDLTEDEPQEEPEVEPEVEIEDESEEEQKENSEDESDEDSEEDSEEEKEEDSPPIYKRLRQ
jgi:hypothetical protein